MVNQRLLSAEGTRAGRFLLCAMLIAGGWAGASWAGQAPAKPDAQKPGVTPTKKGSSPETTKQARARRVKPAASRLPVPRSTEPAPQITNRRDPFKIPPLPAAGRPGQGGPEVPSNLPPGLRGLVISQLFLEGTVRLDTTSTMIAVVTNYTKRAYFLRENDAVYNGVVSKITADAVYFKENQLDQSGRVTSVDVVKRLPSAPGEGR